MKFISRKIFKNDHKYKKGFTLVEIIVVIVIIGILSAVTYMGYNGVNRQAISATIMTELKDNAGALKLYNADHGVYPNSIDASYCPNSPKIDTKNCLKAANGYILEYDGGKQEFMLTETHVATGISYIITESSEAVLANSLSSVKVVDGGPSCSLSEIGQLTCWTHEDDTYTTINEFDAPTAPNITFQPSALTRPAYLENKTIEAVSTGSSRSCVIASDGRGYCWGYNDSNQLATNAISTLQTVPAPLYMDGVLSGKTLKTIYGGFSHSCAIASDDKAYCWGYDYAGDLGDGGVNGEYPNFPVAVKSDGALSGKTIKTMSLGSGNTCAIASDDNVYCWGWNYAGELGNGTSDYNTHNEPIAVKTSGALSGLTVKKLAMGSDHTCVVASDEKIYCWGRNYEGQLGTGTTYRKSTEPVATDMTGALSGKTIKLISSGDAETCVVTTDNGIYCWGSNGSGQLGNGGTAESSVPVSVDMSGVLSGKSFNSIYVGVSGNACVLDTLGELYCWGTNYAGQFGNGTTSDSNIPVRAANVGALNGKTIKDFSIYYTHGCAVASDDKVYCWGENDNGQIGDNTNANKLSPVAVNDKLTYAGETIKDFSVASNTIHEDAFCVLTNSQKMYCWGGNLIFPFGDDESAEDLTVPRQLIMQGSLAGKTVKSIASKFENNLGCLIASDDNVYCWGDQQNGKLGNGLENSVVQYNPVAVSRNTVLNGKSIKKVTIGSEFACAMSTDGKAYCWGKNNYGQLGNGSSDATSSIPVEVDMAGVLSGKTIKDIESGKEHTCVLANDNRIYCWGRNESGQLGNGNTSNSNIPVLVNTSLRFGSISTGSSFSCAVSITNKTLCWGIGKYSRLGSSSDAVVNSNPIDISNRGSLDGKTITNVSASYNGACALTSTGEYYCWGIPGRAG